MITNQRIGVDIGNVIIGGGGADTSFFSDNFLKTPHVPLYRRSLRKLKRAGNEIFFISKCGPVVEEKTRKWFHENSVLWFLGLPEERLFFTKTRAGKVPVALNLGLDVFIDDRTDICAMMRTAGIRAVEFKSWAETMKELEA
jgi:hypothetical protein